MVDKAPGTSREFPVWRTPEGEPVSCVEKIKVLNENLAAENPRTFASGVEAKSFRTSFHTPRNVAGTERGVRPMGD